LTAADPKPDPEDDKLLESAGLLATPKPGLKREGDPLVEFFRKHTGKDADLEKVSKLIAKLGDEKFATRRAAADDLRGIKPVESSCGQLRRVGLTHADVEVRDQCRLLLREIEKEGTSSPQVSAAAARVLRVKKPQGALAVLIAYCPFAPNEQTDEEVLTAIAVLAVNDGKVDASIAGLLKDPVPARQGLAAMFLGRSGTDDDKKSVSKLLEDKQTLIRLRAAQGLVAGHDKSAVPTLVGLLTDGTIDEATQAEDLLACLAVGRNGPRVPLGDTEATRKKCRDAWDAWWKANENKVDLAKAEVDLSPFNATLRMRDTIRRFLTAFNRGDFATVSSLTEMPFYQPGQLFATRQEADTFWANSMQNARTQGLTLGAGSLVRLDDYLRTAPNEKQMFTEFRPDQTKEHYRVLYVNTFVEGRYTPGAAMWQAFLIHIDGPQVRICATGHGTR
jgi:HEAT repeat protein